jgi:hypothetical protein
MKKPHFKIQSNRIIVLFQFLLIVFCLSAWVFVTKIVLSNTKDEQSTESKTQNITYIPYFLAGTSLYTYNPVTHESIQLAGDSVTNYTTQTYARISPDASKLAYITGERTPASNDELYPKSLWMFDLISGEKKIIETNLTTHPLPPGKYHEIDHLFNGDDVLATLSYNPLWTKNNSFIIYISIVDGQNDIHAYNTNTGTVTKYTLDSYFISMIRLDEKNQNVIYVITSDCLTKLCPDTSDARYYSIDLDTEQVQKLDKYPQTPEVHTQVLKKRWSDDLRTQTYYFFDTQTNKPISEPTFAVQGRGDAQIAYADENNFALYTNENLIVYSKVTKKTLRRAFREGIVSYIEKSPDNKYVVRIEKLNGHNFVIVTNIFDQTEQTIEVQEKEVYIDSFLGEGTFIVFAYDEKCDSQNNKRTMYFIDTQNGKIIHKEKTNQLSSVYMNPQNTNQLYWIENKYNSTCGDGLVRLNLYDLLSNIKTTIYEGKDDLDFVYSSK